jgi:hypothetical protein
MLDPVGEENDGSEYSDREQSEDENPQAPTNRLHQ